MPNYFRVAELRAVHGNDRVAGVFRECVSAIARVGDLLHLFLGGVERVDCDHAIILVREEAACVVDVDDCGAGEYAFAFGARVYGNGLVFPMVEILGSSMAPVLVTSYYVCRVVCAKRSVWVWKRAFSEETVHW